MSIYVKCPHYHKEISDYDNTARPVDAYEGEYGDWYGEFECTPCEGRFEASPHTEYTVTRTTPPPKGTT